MAKPVKKKTYSVDFTNVEARVLVPEGDYKIKPATIDVDEGDSGFKYFAWKFEITEGEFEGKFLYTNTSLSPGALWNLRTLLEKLGIEVESDKMELDPEEIIEVADECYCTVEHERYDGKNRPRIVEFFDLTEKGSGKETAAKPGKATSTKDAKKAAAETKATGKAGKTAVAPEPDDAPVPPDFSEMDREDLEKFIDENDMSAAVDLNDFPKLTKARAAVETAWEEAQAAGGGDGEAEGDPDFTAMDLDDLGTFLTEHGLADDVDIDGMPLKKARAAVTTAYEEQQAELAAAAKKGLGKGGKTTAKGAAKAKLYSEDAVMEMRNAGLQKIVEEEGLEVEIGAALKVNRIAVVKALKKAKKLEA